MGLYKLRPPMSGRMGTLRTLASIRGAALVEYGCMGHMLYGRVFLEQVGVVDACRLYSTHIDETDISLGDTGRLHRTIAEIIERDHPEIVFLLPSSVPTVIGTDLPAICRELQLDFPAVPLLPFGAGGFDVFGYQGVREALLLLVRTLPRQTERTAQPTYNIIGSCADLFRFQADAEELVRIMEGAFGMSPLCILTSDTHVHDIERMGGAHINLVIRREGEAAAQHLREQFGIPYLSARPYGIQGTLRWIEQIAELCDWQPNREFVQAEAERAQSLLLPSRRVFQHIVRSHPEEAAVSLGGHADVVEGILAYAREEFSLSPGACWCDSPDMASADVPYYAEDEWMRVVTAHKQGVLMASGEALKWAGRSLENQISNPDVRWRLSPYDPPFVGFRGANHLAGLWLNTLLEQDED